MSWEKLPIDPEILRRYYAKELTSLERHELELRADEDPFLRAAMDGFDENPGSFATFYAKHKKALRPRHTYTVAIALSALLLLFLATVLYTRKIQTPEIAQANTTVLSPITKDSLDLDQNEIEVVSSAIDSLAEIPTNEQITPKVISKSQEELAISDQKKEINERIEIDEVFKVDPDYKTEKEQWNWYKQPDEAIPTDYLYGLKVVDYREIKRETDQIKYKRFELSGVSADLEDENSANELIEKEVEVPYYTYLNKTMSFFNASNYKAALSRFLVILEQYPEDLNALFYSGLSYYNLGKFENSMNYFQQVKTLDFEVFNQEAEWYEAKSYIQLNRKKEAKLLLDTIIMKGGFYASDAIELKAKL